jgi:penicillin-binding protein 1C
MVIALDPDIPPARQRVPFEASGASRTMSLRLDDRILGRASELQLWQPSTGAHVLALMDEDGRVVDRVLFTVR